MIFISKDIYLQKITKKDHEKLYGLMQEIYPPVYGYLWKDNGKWYLNNTYNKEIFLKELLESNTSYFFILYKNKVIGTLRIVWKSILTNFDISEGIVKLHRIYLDKKTHRKGVGKKIVFG